MLVECICEGEGEDSYRDRDFASATKLFRRQRIQMIIQEENYKIQLLLLDILKNKNI